MPRASENPPVRLAITLGDPRGIGPEVVLAAARALTPSPDSPKLIMVGPAGTGVEDAGDEFLPTGVWSAGSARAEDAGRLAGAAIERAATLAIEGKVDGIVTAPVDKRALNAGGYSFPGHTELLASLASAPEVAMLLAAETTPLGGALRVVLMTIHLPLARVPEVLSTDRIVGQGRLTAAALRAGWDIEKPRLALCALNPHASDGGLFGDEEARTLAPACDVLRADGISVHGPLPADTVFLRALRGEFHAVLAPYHDVGMAAFKTAAFGRGVNTTLGLPFIRTSPDHGTALDIAGRDLADPTSMIEAIRLAARLARRRAAVPSQAK